MTLDIQYNIRNNPNYLKYIRENSHWYKILNRNPEMFKVFIQEVKEKYNLRTTDKIEKALQTFLMFQNVLSTMK